MKSKRNKLIIGGVAVIVAMFLLSLFLPAFQPFAKAGALVIYALVNYVQIKEMKSHKTLLIALDLQQMTSPA